jgi:hypothetical protein
MPSVAVPPAKWHHEIPQRAAFTFENADSSKVGHRSGATHLLGGRELVICPPHNPAFHYNGCRISAPSGPTCRDRRSFGISLSAAGMRYHPCRHGSLPGPEHDQHRAMSSSTGPQEFVNQIRAHAPTSSSRQAGAIRPAASLFELRHSSIILGLHCSAVGSDMHARYFR